jgi:hypothetical protein
MPATTRALLTPAAMGLTACRSTLRGYSSSQPTGVENPREVVRMACQQVVRSDPTSLSSTGSEVHHGVTCGRSQAVLRVGHGRRRAGSVSARWRATASGPGRAYRSRERTEACRDRASSRPTRPRRPCCRPGPPVGQVQIRHVQGQELVGAGGGLIQQPPQGSLPQREITAGEQPLELAAGEGPGAVDLDAVTFKVAGRIGGEPAAAPPPADRGSQGGRLPVPGRRRRRGVAAAKPAAQDRA